MTTRLRRKSVVSTVSVFAILAGVLTGTTSSAAGFVDQEFVNGDFTALDCDAPVGLESRATGRFLTGRLGGASLDPVVGLQGVTVSNDGSLVTHSAGAVASGTDAWGQPITASAVGGLISAQLGATLPFDFGTGTYNQYGQAHATGISTGASGAVTNSGAVDTGAISGGTAAKAGTLHLSDLPGLGTTLAGLQNVDLEIGAVAALATLDGCESAWDGTTPSASDIQRSYIVSELKALLTSQAVAALVGTGGVVPNSVGLVQSSLTGLIGAPTTMGTGEQSIATSALNSLTSTVDGLLDGLSTAILTLDIGSGHTATAGLTIDLSTVTSYLTGSLSDGVVGIDLASGRITVDIGGLAGGLNGRDPNTRVLTSTQLNDVLDRVEDLLQARLAQIDTALDTALAAATLHIEIDVKVQATLLAIFPLPGIGPINALNVNLKYDGTLAAFAGGTETVTGPAVTILGGTGIGDALLNPILSGLTSGLLNPIINVVTPAVVTAVASGLTTPIQGLISTNLSTITNGLTSTITALDPVLDALAAIVDITLNSRPDVAPLPSAPIPSPLAGEYFETAIRVGVLNAPGGSSILSLYLASASVGPN
jgi:hypothetical protein